MTAQVLTARGLERHYAVGGGLWRKGATLKAVDGVDLDLTAGRTVAVVGESGSGKSTLARLVTMIEPPTAGTLEVDGMDARSKDKATRRQLRRTVQIVFQNPYGSLNPRQQVAALLAEPLIVNTGLASGERDAAVADMLARVGLRPEHGRRYPHMFSGGQRQRIAIARALMLRPKLVVLDEPVSALDLSIQAQVLNLLTDLQAELGLAYLFISHDLTVVRHIADQILVLYLGKVVERAPRELLFEDPRHPYTRALLAATPIADPERPAQRHPLEGEPPSPLAPPPGCPFNPRCPLAADRCRVENPALLMQHGREVACHAVEEGRDRVVGGAAAALHLG